MLSNHLRVGRPFFSPPVKPWMSIVFLERLSSSLLLMCHTDLILSVSGMLTFGILLHPLAGMTWFLTWSFLVLPLASSFPLLSICSRLSFGFFLTAQHSAPYVIVGLIAVL